MRRPTLWLVPVLALVLTAVVAVLPDGGGGGPGTSPAEARRRISIPFGFDSVELRDNARQVIVTAPVGCEREPSSRYRLDVRIEQDGGVATGHRQGRCTGEVETVIVRAVVNGPGVLRPGPATGTGEFRVFFHGEQTDFVSWDWNNRLG